MALTLSERKPEPSSLTLWVINDDDICVCNMAVVSQIIIMYIITSVLFCISMTFHDVRSKVNA